jgi:hypothetical protein
MRFIRTRLASERAFRFYVPEKIALRLTVSLGITSSANRMIDYKVLVWRQGTRL